MVADVLAPCITRSSAVMILTMLTTQVIVLQKEGFRQLISVWKNDRNCKYLFMFLLKSLAYKELSGNILQMAYLE